MGFISHQVLCTRITYVGELGYELFVPSEAATHVYDTLLAAGRDLGLAHAGLKVSHRPFCSPAHRHACLPATCLPFPRPWHTAHLSSGTD